LDEGGEEGADSNGGTGISSSVQSTMSQFANTRRSAHVRTHLFLIHLFNQSTAVDDCKQRLQPHTVIDISNISVNISISISEGPTGIMVAMLLITMEDSK